MIADNIKIGPYNDISLWSESKKTMIFVVDDFPSSTEHIESTILSLKPDIQPKELNLRLWYYRFLPMYDLSDAIVDLCEHYEIDQDDCFAQLEFLYKSIFDMVRLEQDDWICLKCGQIFSTKDAGSNHLKMHHGWDKQVIGPAWMKFLHFSQLNSNRDIEPFRNDREYFDSFGLMNNINSRNMHGSIHQDQYSTSNETRNSKYEGYINRAHRLVGKRRGIDCRLDQIVIENKLPMLDTIILLNSLYELKIKKLTTLQWCGWNEPDNRKSFDGYQLFPTGLARSEICEYCLSSKRLLDTGLIEIKDGRIDARNCQNYLFKENTKPEGAEIYFLQTSEVTMGNLVVDKKNRSKLELALNSWKSIGKLKRKGNMGKYGRSMAILISGPPGVGKTFTAYAVAGTLGMKIMESNISDIFDKYVGETEKNLRALFNQAQENNALLLIDEADALVSKRAGIRLARDRYINAEINVFLQELERFNGFVILTTNLKTNLDPALSRRIQFKLDYQLPNRNMRAILWEKLIPDDINVNPDVDFQALAKKYQFTGSQIKIAIDNATMISLSKDEGEYKPILSLNSLIDGAEMELEGNNGSSNDSYQDCYW